MRRVLKALGVLLGILVLVIASAAILVPLLIDANDYKTHLVNLVKEKTGRKLEIGGDIKLSIFPWLGLRVDQVRLGNPQGFDETAPFASAASAALHVKLMPLLDKEVEIDTVGLDGLELNLIRTHDGHSNWEDLARRGKKGGEAPSAGKAAALGLGALTIGGVEMKNGRITIDDREQGQRMAFDQIRIKSGAIRDGEPIDLQLGFTLDSQTPPLKAEFDLKGKVQFIQATQRLTVEGMLLTLRAEGAALEGNVLEASIGTHLKLSAAGKPSLATLSGTAEQLQVKIGLQRDGLKGEATLGGILRIDGEKNLFSGEQLKIGLDASGSDLGDTPLHAEMAAELRLALDGDSVEINALHLIADPLRMSGSLRGQGLNKAPQITGNLKLAEFSPRDLLAAYHIDPPATADPEALKRLGGEITLGANRSDDKKQPFVVTLSPLHLELDDSKLDGTLILTGGGYRFDLNLDRIDLDRYLPPIAQQGTEEQEKEETGDEKKAPNGAGLDIENGPEKPAGETEAAAKEPPAKEETAAQPVEPIIPLPLEALRGLDINGALKIGELLAHRLKFGDVELRLQSKGGQVRLENKVGSLYEGSLNGSIALDARGAEPAVHLRQSLSDAQMGPLLDALKGEGRLTGKGKADLDLHSQGSTGLALKKQLNGKAEFRFEDGAIKGVNLAQAIREAEARFKGEAVPAAEGPMQTDFSELSGSALVTDGVLANRDLLMKSPFIRVTGDGELNLPAESLDYTVTATLVASGEGQGGKELTDLTGVPIPVRITESFDHPRYTIDWEKLLVEVQKTELREKAEEMLLDQLDDKLKDQPELQNALKGLFKR